MSAENPLKVIAEGLRVRGAPFAQDVERCGSAEEALHLAGLLEIRGEPGVATQLRDLVNQADPEPPTPPADTEETAEPLTPPAAEPEPEPPTPPATDPEPEAEPATDPEPEAEPAADPEPEKEEE